MNCERFELIINDLARDQTMDVATREQGLAHIEACAGCAMRLADERTLTAGLRAFAASASVEHAPAHTEAALRTMFRERVKANSFASGAVALTSSAGVHRHRARWALTAAAAAAVLVLALLTTLRWQPWSVVPEGAREAYVPQLMPIIDVAASGEKAPLDSTGTPGSIDGKQSGVPQPLTIRAAGSTRRVTPRPYRSAASGVNTGFVNEPVNNLGAGEVATDFLPLNEGGGLDPLDSGQVVRVELPRSALVSFGLPMNVERAHEPITADVLLGEDGVARAVRFINNN